MRCADLKGMFRIIQSVTSKKAEPIKVWMSSVLTQRVAYVDFTVPADSAAEQWAGTTKTPRPKGPGHFTWCVTVGVLPHSYELFQAYSALT